MSEAEQVVPFPQIDPMMNHLTLVIGRKGSGKSVFARELFRDWPDVDKFVIDPTGDADPGRDIGTVTLRQLPDELPMGQKAGEHTVTRWVANPASPTYRDDLDRAIGLALFPKNRRVLLWIDEVGEVLPANKTGPNGRTLLNQSRHWFTSVLMCGPRPITIDPLCIAQADRVVMYDLPNPADRKRVAAAIGIEPAFLNAQLDEIRRQGAYWFLLYDARSHSLFQCPPLPMSKGYKHAQQ